MNVHFLKTLSISTKARMLVFSLLGACLLSACQSNKKDDSFSVTNQRVETRVEPNLSDAVQPRFSWMIESNKRGIEQTYYRIFVSTSYQKLEGDTANVWDSGKIKSGQSIQVPYDGPALHSMTTYFWKVKVWCKGKGYATSDIVSWNTGLFRESDWKAHWIGLDSITADDRWEGNKLLLSARYLRRSLFLDKQPINANLYVAGVGTIAIYLNGLPIGGHVLSSVSTDATNRVMYTMYNLAPYLLPGENVFGIVLGNGTYAGALSDKDSALTLRFPKLLFQLEVTKSDGTLMRLISDASWRLTTGGPVRENGLAQGETQDRTRNFIPNCFRKGYNDASWIHASVTKAPGTSTGKARLVAQSIEEMKVVHAVRPVAILNRKPGSFILDMGQTMAGWVKMLVRGERGRIVTLTYGESLNSDSTLVGGLNSSRDMDRFILAGLDKEEVLSPNFTYHGFRYVQVSNWPGEPQLKQFTGELIADGFNSTGSFNSSNSDLNALYSNAWWTVANTYKGFPLDGSTSALRKPTLACRSNGSTGESFLFDSQRMFANWLSNIQSAMSPLGQIPDVAPTEPYHYSDNVIAAATYFLTTRMLYHQYADLNVVREHYPSMKKWMGYMEKRYVKNGLLQGILLKDKGVPPLVSDSASETHPDRLTDGNLIASAYYIKLLQVMQEFAGLVGNSADQKRFDDREKSMINAFQRHFYHVNAYNYANNTVTANLLPLAFGITPEEDRKAVFNHICRAIEDKNEAHLSTGEVGTAWLLQTLSTYGRPDLALKLATNRSYPSWGYMIQQGATTLWERWNTDKLVGVTSPKNNVALLGDVLSWCYENVAGIRCAPDGPGFKKIILRPDFPDGLKSISASYRSMHGLIVSEWTREGIHLNWTIGIPPNTEAYVYIPAPKDKVYESDKPVGKADGVSFVKTDGDRSVFKLKSGIYRFEVKR